MKYIILIFILISTSEQSDGQIRVDLTRSTPLWLDFNPDTYESAIKWIPDDEAVTYEVSDISYNPLNVNALDTIDGTDTLYGLGSLTPGQEYGYHLRKNTQGIGVITIGIEIPAVHERGRSLILIDDILSTPLQLEIDQLVEDITMDGWIVDTLNISREESVVGIKDKIIEWHDADYDASQSLFILGHVPVPYSGNTAYDGHSDHAGAWPADVFYGELDDGQWTDIGVNNSSPNREANKNIPGDGKYDQSIIRSAVELEVGRVDFHDMPAFHDDEIELTRKYLNKSHAFRTGQKEYPRRALVENNFGSFGEGFGQSGWRNFVPMFGGDSVTVKNYETVLVTDKYLCSYACGPGTYTSSGGVGNINSLWVEKDIKTIFNLNFGSYFGDWDTRNNFLRGALGSGDILTNAWAGRPVWQMYHMALGKHIGYSAKATQNTKSSYFQQGFGANSSHIALMGDPTLRLHAMKRATNISAEFNEGDVLLRWYDSPDASHGYFIYKRKDDGDWILIRDNHLGVAYRDDCVDGNTEISYMVKAVKLETTGSGSYYNTSLGITSHITIGDNPLVSYFADLDMDGFGDAAVDSLACTQPINYVTNDLDCDDNNENINPDAEEIANNGIDEDCDGEDLIVTSSVDFAVFDINIFPNPTNGYLYIDSRNLALTYKIYNVIGQMVGSGRVGRHIDFSDMNEGIYYLNLSNLDGGKPILKKVIVAR